MAKVEPARHTEINGIKGALSSKKKSHPDDLFRHTATADSQT
jgi:hypothetical protein